MIRWLSTAWNYGDRAPARSENDGLLGLSGMRIWRSFAAGLVFVLGTGAAVAGPDDENAGAVRPIPGYTLENLRPSSGDMAVQPGASAFQVKTSIVPSGTLNVGPVVNYSQNRTDFSDPRIDDPSRADPAWEAGAFVDYRINNGSKPNTVVGLNFQMSPGTADSRNGWLFLPNLYYQAPVGDSWNVRADLSSTYATDNAMGMGSTVGGSGAARRGLDGFDGDAGFKDVGIGVGVTYNLTPSWDVDTALRYQRLLEDAADNPAANDPGAANQLFGGVLLRYKF